MRMKRHWPRTPIPPPQHPHPSTVIIFPRCRHRYHVTWNPGTWWNEPVSFPGSLSIGVLVSLGLLDIVTLLNLVLELSFS